MNEELRIMLECTNTGILGVFGKDVHLFAHFWEGDKDGYCVLIIPEGVYIKEWKKWLKGKREYCERYDHYCGVMGHVYALNPEKIGMTTLNRWNEDKFDMKEVDFPVYKASKFDVNDFEHG